MNRSATPGLIARAVGKSLGEHVVLDRVDLAVAEGTIFALLGPNGAGKTTMVRILSTLIPADRTCVAGHDVGDPEGCERRSGSRQFSAVDKLLTGVENLRLMADLNHLGRARTAPGAELLDRFDLADAADAAVDLLRGDAPPARPGDDPRRRAPGDLPRRADRGPRSAQPSHDVGDHRRTGRGRRHDLPHDPVPRRGRPAR